jgi:excisionase family DNA binding protein
VEKQAMSAAIRSVGALDQKRRAGFASVKDASDFMSLSRSTIYELMDKGELRYAKIGKSRRIPWAALEELAEKSMVA